MTGDMAEVAWSARVEIATSSIAAATTPAGELPASSRRLSARVQAILAASPALSAAVEAQLRELNTAGDGELRPVWRRIETALAAYNDDRGSLWP
jgi:hypothetical protein